jgi:hypothetical protein
VKFKSKSLEANFMVAVKYTFSGILCLTPENEGQAFLKILIPPSL